ncbi:MAG: glycosyltransferase family 4 protein [Actinomycetota bacterium]|nr:glycosyltransferase family 4 protein [Actinomycetota bacterium]
METEPRVLVLTPDFPPAPGGIQLLVHRIARHADRLCVRVVAVDGPGVRGFDATSGLDVQRVGLGAGRRLGVAALNARALAEAARFRPAAVLSGHIVTAPAAALIAAILHIPVVQYLYAREIGGRPRLAAFAMRRADAVVAISAYTHGLALANGAQPARVHRILPGVDLPPADTIQRAERPTILTISRLSERYKGHDVILRAVPLIRSRVPDVEWVVVGDGPLRPGLERTVAGQGLQGNVRFVGAVSDSERDRWLRRAHVFTMPSRLPAGGLAGEGFGIVYLEAAAHGLPVVAGNVGGALDDVVHDQTGVLVDPTDHVALADAIADLLLNPSRAQALGVAGARRALEFTWPTVARQVEDLVLGLLAGRPPSVAEDA